MCEFCLQSPCLDGYPNNNDIKPVKACEICSCDIYPGDEYYDIDGEIFCEKCMAGYRKVAEEE